MRQTADVQADVDIIVAARTGDCASLHHLLMGLRDVQCAEGWGGVATTPIFDIMFFLGVFLERPRKIKVNRSLVGSRIEWINLALITEGLL